MRSAFVSALESVAARDSRVVLLTGDLGFNMLEPFADRFPGRYFNVGVSEQNMIGMATGMAEAGLIPFAYSISTFATMRPYEFIRNGPIFQQLPVRIVGVGGGVEYGNNGATHYGVEDIAILRAHRDMSIVVPASSQRAHDAIVQTYASNTPIYYRLSKNDYDTEGLSPTYTPGGLSIIREGRDIGIVALGPAADDCSKAAGLLSATGVSAAVAVVEGFNPSPTEELRAFARRFSTILSVEAHLTTGGLGSFVAEVIADGGLRVRLERCGIEELPRGLTGTQGFLHETLGISAEAIASRCAVSASDFRPSAGH